MSAPRGLVLVRAGNNHRFDSLMRIPREQRSWDIALSFYDESAPPEGSIVEWQHRCRGGKWDGIWQFFAEHRETLAGYDYYWLVDDDIEADADRVEALFGYARHHDLKLAQPALTHDSYVSHRVTLACPGFLHRHTNLVEIMAPLVSATLLTRLLPLFQDSHSGFGLDWYWQTLVPDPGRQIAIIDSLPVRHGRPLRQNLRSAMRREGISPEEERERLAMTHGIRRLHGVATGGLTRNGKRIDNRTRMALRMATGYWRVRRQITRRRWGFRETVLLVYRQVFAHLGYSHRD